MNVNGYILSVSEVWFLATFSLWLLFLLLCTLPTKVATGWLFEPERRSFYTVMFGLLLMEFGRIGGWYERKEWLIYAALFVALCVGWSGRVFLSQIRSKDRVNRPTISE